MNTLQFAKQILEIPSPSGYTKNIIAHLAKECENNNLDFEITKKGNLIITMKGQDDYIIGLSAHVDTLGAMVRSINADGTLKFTAIGSPTLPTYDGEYCYILTRDQKQYTGTFLSNSPAMHVHDEARTLTRNEKNMHIRLDEKVRNRDDVKKLGINAGDFIAVESKTVITDNGFIKSRFLDDKISVAILFALIRHIIDNNMKLKHNLKFIISTYEEVGHGATNIPEVDELIAVDMGCIGEDLTCTEYDVSICAKDSFSPYDYDITNKLLEVAKKLNLNYALDIYPYYSSDVSAALRGGNNFKGGLIGPGVSASHGMERTHQEAVENTLKLLIGYINE